MSERSHDYPAKNVVREVLWPHFLPGPTLRSAPVHGLYLGGTENLELAVYRSLGIRPCDLIVSEHDQRRVPIVVENAGGTRVIAGSVIEAVRIIISEGLPRLLFANLDFEGSFVTYLDDLLSVFRVLAEEEAYLGVTSYCARDDQALAQCVADVSKFYSCLGDRAMFHRDFGIMVNRHRHLRLQLSDMSAEDHTHASRMLSFLWWAAMGMGLVDEGSDGYRIFDRAYLDEAIDGPLREIAARARELSDRPSDLHLIYEPELANALQERRSALWPTDFQHIAYMTQSRNPMRTWFLRVERVDSESRPNLQDILRQLWKLAVRAPLLFVDEFGTIVKIG